MYGGWQLFINKCFLKSDEHQKKVSSMLGHQAYLLNIDTHGINVISTTTNTD